jgi:P27 family predicted phage terminase small subunit
MTKKKKKGGAPPQLSADARQVWREIIAEYDGWGVVELSILCSALEAYDRMRQAQKELRKKLFMKDKYGQVRPHPCVAIERDSRQAYLRALNQLGIGSMGGSQGRPSQAVT